MKLIVEFALLKDLPAGLNAHPLLLGVARYALPGSNPVCDHRPFVLVRTEDGMAPLPDTRVNAILTPEWFDWPDRVTRPETA